MPLNLHLLKSIFFLIHYICLVSGHGAVVYPPPRNAIGNGLSNGMKIPVKKENKKVFCEC